MYSVSNGDKYSVFLKDNTGKECGEAGLEF